MPWGELLHRWFPWENEPQLLSAPKTPRRPLAAIRTETGSQELGLSELTATFQELQEFAPGFPSAATVGSGTTHTLPFTPIPNRG